MLRTTADRWRERRTALERFSRWVPGESALEAASRLRWLDDALRLARSLGGLRERPFDSAEIRAHRSRIRTALAMVHV